MENFAGPWRLTALESFTREIGIDDVSMAGHRDFDGSVLDAVLT